MTDPRFHYQMLQKALDWYFYRRLAQSARSLLGGLAAALLLAGHFSDRTAFTVLGVVFLAGLAAAIATSVYCSITARHFAGLAHPATD